MNKKMKIALTGISGSGKDFFTEHLVKQYGFKRYSFSDQLKIKASKVFDWLEVDYPPEVKENPLGITTSTGEVINLSPREIWLKMNFLRNIEDNLFISGLKQQMERDNLDKIIISDIRTENELEFCKKEKFTLIKIKPMKNVIHKKHSFDNQLIEYEDKFIIFENNFNGVESFDLFLKNNVFKD